MDQVVGGGTLLGLGLLLNTAVSINTLQKLPLRDWEPSSYVLGL